LDDQVGAQAGLAVARPEERGLSGPALWVEPAGFGQHLHHGGLTGAVLRPAPSGLRAAPSSRTAAVRPPGPSLATVRYRLGCPGRGGPGGSRDGPPAIPDCYHWPQANHAV